MVFSFCNSTYLKGLNILVYSNIVSFKVIYSKYNYNKIALLYILNPVVVIVLSYL